jgi:outer membrane receptor protein involved in Fe transport
VKTLEFVRRITAGVFVSLLAGAGLAAEESDTTAAPASPPTETSQKATSARSSPPGEVEEVTITARKREERAIDVPVAVAALSGSEVDRYYTRDLSELTTRLPGLSIAHGAGGGAGGNIVIRGVGNLAVDYGADQPVTLVLDGMSFTRGHILDVGFFDLGSVEVLKGPQALYFGKNSPAGVLAVSSRSPTVGGEPEYLARIGYEFVTKDPTIEAGVSVPIGDTFAVRLAGRYQNMQGGYLKNTARPIDPNPLYLTPLPTRGKSYDRWPEQEQHIVRLTAVWEPIEALDAKLKVFHSFSKQSDAGPTVLYACADGVGGHPYFVVFPDLSQTCTKHLKLRRNGALPPAGVVATHPHVDVSDHFFNKFNNEIYTLELNYSLDNLKFTSVTGYWDYRHREYTNYDYTSYAVVTSNQGESGSSFNQELRVQSSFDGPVNFMFGGFYEHTQRDLDAPVQILPPIFFPPGYIPNPIPGPYFGTYINYHQHWENSINSWSVFTNIDWKLAEDWELSWGARYTQEKRHSFGGNLYERSGFLGFSPGGVFYRPHDNSNNISPEVTLSWHPLDDFMVYAAYKTGFQSAGISNPGTVPNLTSLTPDQQSDALVFDESKVRGFEAGVKGYFFDSRLSADVIAYRYQYKDLQVGIFNPVTTTFTIQNAAAATNSGFEIQGTYQATDALQLRASMQYNHLAFDRFTDAGCNAIDDARPIASLPPTGPGCHISPVTGKKIQDLSGVRYGGPPVQFNAGATYDWSIAGEWGLELTGDVIYFNRGQKALRQAGTAIPARAVANLSARLHQSDGPWQLALICSNCFNEIYVTSIGNKPLAKTGDLTGAIAPPRLVSLQLSYEVR